MSLHKWTGPNPAERDVGIMHSYFECDLCGQCSSDPDESEPCPA